MPSATPLKEISPTILRAWIATGTLTPPPAPRATPVHPARWIVLLMLVAAAVWHWWPS